MKRRVFAALAPLALAPRAVRAQNTVVRVITPPVDSACDVFVAKELGLFAKHGLDVDIQPGTNGSAMATAVVANAVDVGYSDLVTLAKAYLKGIAFVAIAPAALWTSAAPTAALVVPNGSLVNGAKDLAGKVIAIPGLATLAEYSPRAWIDQNGGNDATAKFIEMPYSEMPAALAAGRVDAAYVAEPFFTVARKDVRVLGYAHNAVAKQFLQSAWFTTATWAAAHPDAVRRFAAAMRDAAQWANQRNNHARSGEILAKYAKLDPATIASMERAQFAERLTPALIQPAIDVSAKYGGFVAFPADRIVYR
jgi:NitT/TauT family transport system substrate-binding protein